MAFNPWFFLDFCKMLNSTQGQSHTHMFLNSPSSFPCFCARAFKSWVQGESKRIHAGTGDQARDYTIMSRVVFLPNISRKISKQEKSLLLNYSLASKDNITLAEDFCHGKDGMNFFLFLFCWNLKLHVSFRLWCLLNIGLWQHDREKKQRVPPLTCSQSLYSCVRLSFLDTWLIVTAVYWGYFIWKRICQWNVNELPCHWNLTHSLISVHETEASWKV